MIYLDTHVVVWLYAGLVDKISPKAKQMIEDSSLLISPMVLLELQYLYERERICVDGPVILNSLKHSIGLEVCNFPFTRIVAEGLQQSWTRDPFDRLIVAHAKARNMLLLTADESIWRNYLASVW